jgi:hypothetical protein
MSFHLFDADEYECANCRARFVPLEPLMPCPQCETPVAIATDFIGQLVSGLSIHRSWYGGRFTPGAYYVGSPAESTFLWICRILDAACREVQGPDIEGSVEQVLTVLIGENAPI